MRAIERRLRQIERLTHVPGPADPGNVALERTAAALLDAVGGLDPIESLAALLGRIEAGCVTDADTSMMESLPRCSMAPAEIIRRMVEVQDKF